MGFRSAPDQMADIMDWGLALGESGGAYACGCRPGGGGNGRRFAIAGRGEGRGARDVGVVEGSMSDKRRTGKQIMHIGRAERYRENRILKEYD